MSIQTANWAEFLSRIPEKDQALVFLGLSTGADISVQTILQVGESFVLVRGRLSGNTDGGQTFFVPYDRLTFLQFTEKTTSEALLATFGPDIKLPKKSVLELEAEQAGEKESESSAPATPPPMADSQAGRVAALREQLRSRLNTNSLRRPS
jgi:hypothetical protein